MRAVATALFVIAVAALGACGGSDEPECPTDDCSIPGSTVVKWRLNDYPEWGFPADTCLDLGVAMVRVEAVHQADPALYFTLDKPCSEGQGTFLRLPDGTYDVVVTPLDAAGASMVSTGARGTIAAGVPGLPTETIVNVPYTAWTGTYTGTLLFKLSWAGMTCEAAAVASQNLRLMVKGQPSDKLVDNGQKLDGSDDKPCRSHTESFAQFAENLPFGPATLRVIGKDPMGMMKFDREFELFIGAGKNNPTFMLDVPAPPSM